MDTTPPPLPISRINRSAAVTPLEYATDPATQYALYSPNAVGFATFLGSPLAGCAILAINYRRLGRPAAALKTLIAGLLATIALIGIGLLLSQHAPTFLIAIIPIVIMAQLAKVLQGEAFIQHKFAGGKIASLWKAAGIALICIVLMFAIAFTVIFTGTILMKPSLGTRLSIGNSGIYYSGSATQADAQAVGRILTNDGYFKSGRAVTVLISKDASGTTLQFVVNENAARQDSTLNAFSKITEQIAPFVGGKPITLKLINPELKELNSKQIE